MDKSRKSKDLGQKKNLKLNALDIYSSGKRLVDCYLRFRCPICLEEMKCVYMVGRILFCKKCKRTFEIILKNSSINYETAKNDGWIKEDDKEYLR